MKYWDKAWSLVSQCSWVSDACDNCWLRNMDKRFGKEWNGKVAPIEKNLEIPIRKIKPATFAIWSDLFHESIPADFIKNAFDIMEYCKQHTFLVLTKRPERLEPVLYSRHCLPNVWLGTTIEDQDKADERIPELLKCEPFNLFLSVEPLLSGIKLPSLKGTIKQIIVGCESGAGARETDLDWVRDLRNQCKDDGIPLLIKQLQVEGKFTNDINKFPEDLRIRELMWKVKK